MRQSEDVKELITALSKAQGEFKSPDKSGLNKHLNYKYSTFADMKNATKEALSKNGIAVMQFVKNSKEEIKIETQLSHNSGQYVISDELMFCLPSNKTLTIQELGSYITYLKKYDYSTILGLGGEDDPDAETKEPTNGKQQKKQEQLKQEKTQVQPQHEQKKIDQEVKALWNRTRNFYNKEELGKIIKEKWNVESSSQLTEQQLTEWEKWITNLETKEKPQEQKKETITPSTPAPWEMIRPGQVEQITKLSNDLQWTEEDWETYKKNNNIKVKNIIDLDNVTAGILINYLEEKSSSSIEPKNLVNDEEATKILNDTILNDVPF